MDTQVQKAAQLLLDGESLSAKKLVRITRCSGPYHVLREATKLLNSMGLKVTKAKCSVKGGKYKFYKMEIKGC